MSNKTIALLLATLMVTVAGIGIVSAETDRYTTEEWYSYMSEHMANFMGRGTGYGMMGGYGDSYGMMNGDGTGTCLAGLGDASGTAPELTVKTVEDALVIAQEEINSDVQVENIHQRGRFWIVYYTDDDTIESARIDAFTGEVVDETTDFAQSRTGRQGRYGRGSGMGYGMMYGR